MTGQRECTRSLEIGFEFYKGRFFLENGIPKYYSDAVFPIDTTSAGQAILALCRFSDLHRAARVAN